MEVNNKEPVQVPSIPESELKLPEEQTGNTAPPAPHSLLNAALFGILLVLLVLLALVVIWGEQLLNLFLPNQVTDPLLPPEMAEPAMSDNEAELQVLENELNEVDLSDIEAELDAIEAEIEAELSTEADVETES